MGTSREAAIGKLRDLIRDIDVAMLTTAMRDGTMHSRPMAAQQVEFDGDLWFFTGQSTAKAGEIAENRAVNVSYVVPGDQRYVSVSGSATLVRDARKAEALWHPIYRAWFPDGLQDPDLVLLRVDVERAEYWDAPSSKMVALTGFAKAMLAGRGPAVGQPGRVTLDTSGN